MPKNGLVILHLDGVSRPVLEDAVASGDMPFVRKLLLEEGYEVLPYRCGIPSTTPFAQAGILYGDNSEIPSFRWWDRKRRVAVQFGASSTFKKVADGYFHGCHPLTEGGACIAACYPAGAADDFGISYHERTYSQSEGSRSAWRTLGPYLLVIAGIPITMVVWGKLLFKLDSVYSSLTGQKSEVQFRAPWLKSMRGERDSGRRLTVLELTMVISVSLALFAFGVWFFLFAGSSLPGA